MRLLLDTHVWVWSLLDSERLSPAAAAALRDPAHELFLSPVSIWELMILAERGRVILDGEPAAWVERTLRESPLREAPLTSAIAIRSGLLDLPHQDPADRFLAATAVVEDLTLLTADRRLLACDGVATLAAA